MKSKFLLLFIVIILITTTGCPPPEDNGSDILNVFYGTITVPDSSYWTNIVLGIFSGGDGGDYPQLEYDRDNYTNNIFRLTYSDNDDGSDVEIPQVSGATSNIASSGDTSRTYSFELPLTLPQSDPDEKYHVICFYDNDTDGNIDLKDMDPWYDSSTTAEGEFNRFPTKDTTNVDEEPTTINIFYFIESQDINGNPSGNYKYVGYDNNAYNEQAELDDDHNTGINFNITANTGW